MCLYPHADTETHIFLKIILLKKWVKAFICSFPISKGHFHGTLNLRFIAKFLKGCSQPLYRISLFELFYTGLYLASCHLFWESNFVLGTKKKKALHQLGIHRCITLECKLTRTDLVQIPGATVTNVRLLFYQSNNVWLANWSSHISSVQCNLLPS